MQDKTAKINYRIILYHQRAKNNVEILEKIVKFLRPDECPRCRYWRTVPDVDVHLVKNLFFGIIRQDFSGEIYERLSS